MSDDMLSKAGRYAARDDVRGALDDIDIDHPGDVLKKILAKPSAIPAGAALFLRCIL